MARAEPLDQLREALAALTGLSLPSPEIDAITEGVAEAVPEAAYLLFRTGYGRVTLDFADKKFIQYEMSLTGKKPA